MKRALSAAVAVSLCVSGLPVHAQSSTAQTVGGGGLGGAAIGAGIGGLSDGGRGAARGAAIGALVGLAVGGYVAHQKNRYASIRARITGERQIAQQATAAARAELDTSEQQLALLDEELVRLAEQRASRTQTKRRMKTVLGSLRKQRDALEDEQKVLRKSIKNQENFVAVTERDPALRRADGAQLARWKATIPQMHAALLAMTTQVANIRQMERRVQGVRTLYG